MAKNKIKTNRAAAKRFRVRSGGSIKRKKAFMRHGMRKRTANVKRKLRQMGRIAEADVGLITRLLPNG